MTERLGVFGGTFDPVHHGHLLAASDVRDALGLDRVMLVVAGDPWQKAGRVHASARDRLALVDAAVARIEGLEASDLECTRPGPTYTVDTLRQLARPDRELFLILGQDAAARLDTWHEHEQLRSLASLVVVNRGDADHPPPPGAHRVPIPRLDISSTDIRLRIAARRSIYGLVPIAVVRRIAERGLYTDAQW
jgi:nicotinate-nucleotide adenylyltransferase